MLIWWLVVAVCATGAMACPQHCSCFTDADGFKSANCSTLALGSVQPSSLDLLSFQPHDPGYPTKLAPRAFLAFSKVKHLWVVNCSVLNLPNDVFHGLDYVIRMDLSYNKIRHLNGGVFKSLVSLHTLLLRGNPLLLTPWDVIVSESLQELDLGHCGLRTIPQGTFISVPRLSRLYLDGNEIHTFTFNMIPAGLRYLNLARNRIVNVPTDVLTTMSYLTKLDLSKNPIKCNCNLVIMQDWFSGQGIIFENGVMCSEPSQYAGKQLSKINENELCTLEEVKRQRKINDIESYRDSKAHRTHNMIHDPDLQADQPDGELYSEVLYDNKETRGLGTHMELSKQLYPPPSDLSDENNKLAASKQDLVPMVTDLASPTKVAVPNEDETVSTEKTKDLFGGKSDFNNTYYTDEISTEDLSLIDEVSFSKHFITGSLIKDTSDPSKNKNKPDFTTVHSTKGSVSSLKGVLATDSPENEMADEGYSPVFTSTPHTKLNLEDYDSVHNASVLELASADEGYNQFHNISQGELMDEGYSPVHIMSNVTLSEEGGSGDDGIDIQDDSYTTISDNGGSSTPTAYAWPSSKADSVDYSYDTQHDYSAEIVHTTEAMNTTDTEEGSGTIEEELLINSSLPPYISDENETFTDDVTSEMDSTTAVNISEEYTTDTYYSSSLTYSSSTQTTNLSSENVTDGQQTVESTTEFITEDSTIALIDVSSETLYVPSSSATISSSSELAATSETTTSPTYPSNIITSTEMSSTSTETQLSSSSEQPFIPIIEPEVYSPAPDHSEEVKETSTVREETHVIDATTFEPSPEIEVISRINKENEKEPIKAEPNPAEREEGRNDGEESTLTYVIAGVLVVLVLVIISTVFCKKVLHMGPCTSKKKVRLPQDTEANLATEMQDMLLPKPPENGVKIIPQNGTPNGKEVKEEEIPVLQKEWDEKPEPIETVTARMSVIAGPQTPVFIHKTLA